MNPTFSACAQIARVDLPKIVAICGSQRRVVDSRVQDFETIFDEVRKQLVHHDWLGSLASLNLRRISRAWMVLCRPLIDSFSFSLSSL
jgi:hypothetical protein